MSHAESLRRTSFGILKSDSKTNECNRYVTLIYVEEKLLNSIKIDRPARQFLSMGFI